MGFIVTETDSASKDEKAIKSQNGVEIITVGKSSKFFQYDMVNVKLTFSSGKEAKSKAEALNFVTDEIIKFDKEVLKKIGIKTKERYNTNDLTMNEDEISRSFVISFGYSKAMLAHFIELVENNFRKGNPPFYEISFTFNNFNGKYNEILASASKNAKDSANVIASGIGVTVRKCLKVEFAQDINDRVEGHLASNPLLAENCEIPEHGIEDNADESKDAAKQGKSLSNAIIRHIKETFIPEAVEISATVKCIWHAE